MRKSYPPRGFESFWRIAFSHCLFQVVALLVTLPQASVLVAFGPNSAQMIKNPEFCEFLSFVYIDLPWKCNEFWSNFKQLQFFAVTLSISVNISLFLKFRLRKQTQCFQKLLFLYLLNIFAAAAPKWKQNFKYFILNLANGIGWMFHPL